VGFTQWLCTPTVSADRQFPRTCPTLSRLLDLFDALVLANSCSDRLKHCDLSGGASRYERRELSRRYALLEACVELLERPVLGLGHAEVAVV
jgi:hypothetical protein